MKIKFIKPFRFIGNAPDDGSDSEVPVGHIVDLENDESTRWLIDNGFAEEVIESGWWKPKYNEEYFYVGNDGSVYPCLWANDPLDNGKLKLGNVFKTAEAATHCRDYLMAVATVRQDGGVLTPEEIRDVSWTQPMPYVGVSLDNELGVCQKNVEDEVVIASAIYFDTKEHAQASLDEHWNEWKIIANYDWSRE